METQEMKISEIKPAHYNPRRDLKPGDPEFEKLKASIERWDLVEPLIVNKHTGVLVGGHQRLKVCKALGMKKAYAVMVDLTPEREKLLNIALNKISGDWDYEKLEALFKRFGPEDLGITGFDEDEIKDLVGKASEAAEAILSDVAESKALLKETVRANEFTVFLSFPEKEVAKDWLEENGVESEFINSRIVNVRMGSEHDED